MSTVTMHDWTETQGTLTRRFTFNNFADALAFVNKVGALAEEVNHHPNITLQNYNEVLIETTTHDAGNTITEKDRTLAEGVNLLY